MANEHTKKVGLLGLTAIVLGSMIGGGVFNLPSNMADDAALGAVIIAWIITGFGMYFLAMNFKRLSDLRPDLSSGIYAYAAEGFGKYTGFNSAWGYWLSAAIGNVSFTVLLLQALGFFFPFFLDSASWQSLVGGSVFIWVMNVLVRRGVKEATLLNLISTIAKLAPLALFVIILLFSFHWDKLSFDIWGKVNGLGSISGQLKSTMLVTLWAFIGIEGAVVISGRAKKSSDVGKATMIGFVSAVAIYAAISIFSFGVMHQAKLAGLPDPSMAYVLKAIVGDWGATVINLGVIISVLGAWIAWTILTSEVPSSAAKEGVLPKAFARHNKNEAPVYALTVTSIIMQLTLLCSAFAKNAFLAIISISGSMILIPYALSAMFLLKMALSKSKPLHENIRKKAMMTAGIATLYSFWLIYAAGLKYILMSSILYAVGILVYRKAIRQRQKGRKKRVFTKAEQKIVTVLCILAAISVIMLLSGVPVVEEAAHWFKLHVL